MDTPDDTDYTIHSWKDIPVYQSYRKSLTTDMLHGTCVHGAPIGKIKSRTPKEFRERGSVMFDRSYILAYLNNAIAPFNCAFDADIVDKLASAPVIESGHSVRLLSVDSTAKAIPNQDLLESIVYILERFRLANSTATSERNKKAYELIKAIEDILPNGIVSRALGKVVSDRLNGKNV